MKFDKQWKVSEQVKEQRKKVGYPIDFGPGPWQDEPDKAQWKDEATGLDCLIVRNAMGALCGYVGVPPGHPAHGAGYDAAPLEDVRVHGGLTFAGACHPDIDESAGVCHVAAPGSPEPWWLGFDCAHAFDLSPWSRALWLKLKEKAQGTPEEVNYRGQSFGDFDVYRDINYVAAEVTQLAAQLAALA